jgi:hypothetical protein
MKNLLLFSALLVAAAVHATPPKGTGGYLGHRIIVGGEVNVSPFYTSFKDFYTKYNVQYGGNLNVIVGRRTQVGLNYNMWSLGNNQVFEGNFVSSDRVKGAQYGITVRNFRSKRGGLAPIGKFWDVSLSYVQNKFVAGSDNPDVLYGEPGRLPVSSDQIMAHVAFGSQMVFWNRLVASTGVRFGAPLFQVSKHNGTAYGDFLYNRMLYKECFSAFVGIGVLL